MVHYEIGYSFLAAKQYAVGYVCFSLVMLAVLLPMIRRLMAEHRFYYATKSACYAFMAVVLFFVAGFSVMDYLDEKQVIETYRKGEYYQLEGSLQDYTSGNLQDSFSLKGVSFNYGSNLIGYRDIAKRGGALKEGDRVILRYVTLPYNNEKYIAYIESVK